MRHERFQLMLGPVAFVWFFTWTVLLDLLRPDYFFAHKAISELGAVGAPYMAVMNVLGFIATGVMLMLFAAGFFRSVPGPPRMTSGLLGLAGLLFAVTAVPITMTQDGNPDFTTDLTKLHLLFTQIAVIPWFVALIMIIARFKQSGFRALATISVGAILTFFAVAVAQASGIGASTPGLMQRLWFAAFLGWYAAAGGVLLRNAR